MSKKIAYILKMYPRFSETFIVNEILELERQGVDVRIYSLRKPDDGRFHPSLARVKAGVIYVPQYPQMEPERVREAHELLRSTFPARYETVRHYTLTRGHDYAIKRFLQAGIIATHLIRQPVDAMHAHFASSATRVANLVYHLCGIPYSFTAHAKDIFHESVSDDSLRAKIRDARWVATVSQFNVDHLRALVGDGPGEVRRLYNGIDLTHFRPDSTTPRQPNLILGVGRLVEKKGFDVLLQACAILAQRGVDFQCEIIGKGDRRGQLEEMRSAYGLQERVHLLGPKPQDDVLQAYQRSAIFTLPCIIGKDGNRDGLPTVLLEAMAAGLPAVSTAVTGNPEIIDHGENGFIVPPNDPLALANALQELLLNPPLRRQMAAAARAKVERCFDVRRNVAQLHQWLAEPVPPQLTEIPADFEVRPGPMPILPTPTLMEVLNTL